MPAFPFYAGSCDFTGSEQHIPTAEAGRESDGSLLPCEMRESGAIDHAVSNCERPSANATVSFNAVLPDAVSRIDPSPASLPVIFPPAYDR
jgi:hypothetical protein